MFENALGLETVTGELSREILRGELPPAILLAGPRYGGKSTVALEIARSLSCREGGRWDCRCHSCGLHRTLSHPGLVCAGPRYFDLEIAASLEAYRREPRGGTLFLLIRAVRKLVRRFDSALWSDLRLKKILPALEPVEELLQAMEPPPGAVELPPGGIPETSLKKLESALVRFQRVVPHELVPVDLVRALAGWAHVSSADGVKVAIIEEAHTLQEGARNSLLKLLEEPPRGVHLILTTSQRSAVIPTLLSRLRTYYLPDRPRDVQDRVQEKIFRQKSGDYSSLASFFRSSGGGDAGVRRDLVDQVVDQALQGRVDGDLLEKIGREYAQGTAATSSYLFFEEFSEVARDRLRRAQPRETLRLQRWGPLLRAYRSRIEVRNMHPVTTITGFLLAIQDGQGG
ncbi:DNA polymerase-3 subunit gamma/tau [Alkalispirochaeta americana]|uniref:DNA polymerase-3 subunit gamma/tau n=1 Tax=Alkalispirochaeta americana TaxID=159291 RepID=A0A1N6UXM3_9SPIO|nr:hypothetical protein [Alkalispirochaeta americana]SIQ70242.1 DNA polymerase-3 subunit gamma/tau [Alkalispirochaeta americana]